MKLDQYKSKENLNKKLWQSEEKLREDVRETLLQIANDFIEEFDKLYLIVRLLDIDNSFLGCQ